VSWKYKGLNPLPGGYQNYLNFIAKLLEKAETDKPSRSELWAWIRSEFQVTGEKSPKSYLHMMLTLGLVSDSQGGLSLSARGKEFLMTRNTQVILKALVENYSGVEEIIVLLKKKPKTSHKEIGKILAQECNLKWTTPTQIGRRLSWLRALGQVVRIDDYYSLSSDKRE